MSQLGGYGFGGKMSTFVNALNGHNITFDFMFTKQNINNGLAKLSMI